jgi:hypothetical protein
MHRLGNLKTQSFKEVWNNDNYKQFRKELMTSRKNIDICANLQRRFEGLGRVTLRYKKNKFVLLKEQTAQECGATKA